MIGWFYYLPFPDLSAGKKKTLLKCIIIFLHSGHFPLGDNREPVLTKSTSDNSYMSCHNKPSTLVYLILPDWISSVIMNQCKKLTTFLWSLLPSWGSCPFTHQKLLISNGHNYNSHALFKLWLECEQMESELTICQLLPTVANTSCPQTIGKCIFKISIFGLVKYCKINYFTIGLILLELV